MDRPDSPLAIQLFWIRNVCCYIFPMLMVCIAIYGVLKRYPERKRDDERRAMRDDLERERIRDKRPADDDRFEERKGGDA